MMMNNAPNKAMSLHLLLLCWNPRKKNLEISLRNLTILELPMPLTQKSFPRKPLRFFAFSTKFCPKKLDLSVNTV